MINRLSRTFRRSDPLPAVITVAVTGDVHDKTRVPTVPITPEEQVRFILGVCGWAGSGPVDAFCSTDGRRVESIDRRYPRVL